MAAYALDFVYHSQVNPVITDKYSTNPVSMAYGFVQLNPSGSNKEFGEKIDIEIRAGEDEVSFSVFDMADPPAAVTSINIQCTDITDPDNPQQASPFDGSDGWSKGGITFSGADVDYIKSTYKNSSGSGGCNINTPFGLAFGRFAAKSSKEEKTYEITITVTLNNTMIFQTDPELEVMGDGS